jgi:regulator of telomere elongation helicase 1
MAIINDLGLTLLTLSKKVPGGMLVFFPSKGLMVECEKSLKWKELFTNLVILRETDYSESFIKNFKEKIGEKTWEHGQAILLMGWCRGKISEGLDFADDSARLVCVIGIANP